MLVTGGASGFLALETAPLLADGQVAEWVTAESRFDEGLVGYLLSFPDCDEVDVVVGEGEGPPPDPEARFTRVVEVSVSGGAVLGNDAGDSEVVVPLEERGEFRVRLSVDETDASKPVLLLQSWPASGAEPVELRGAKQPTRGEPRLLLPEAADGLAAARRIGRDVDDEPGARQLTAQDAIARASIEVPGKPERLSDYFDQARVWTPDEGGFMWTYSWALDGPVAFMRHAGHPDRVSGWTGALWTSAHSSDRPPLQRVHAWNWLVPADRSNRVDDECQEARKLLSRDTIRSVTLTRVTGDAQARTRIEVVHEGLPVEWAEDMAAWWTYQLAILADMLARPAKG